jgi:hypothetical protein
MKRIRFNCVNNTGDQLLYQHIIGEEGTMINELNVMNKIATGSNLLYGGISGALNRKYSHCVFVKNDDSTFAIYIKIDFFDSVFDNNPTSFYTAVRNKLSGSNVSVANSETIDVKTCINSDHSTSFTSLDYPSFSDFFFFLFFHFIRLSFFL